MIPDDALSTLDAVLIHHPLNDIQEQVFQKIWEGLTYEQIASELSYDVDYIKHVGSKVLLSLSNALGQKVTKSNCRSILRRISHYTCTEESHLTQATAVLESSLKEENYHQSSLSIELKKNQEVRSYSVGFTNQRQDWGKAIDVSIFYGRQQELAQLEQWIVGDRCRFVVLLGMGGIGKTALAIKLAQQIQTNFDFIIWRSLRNAPTLEKLLSDVIRFISNYQETKADIGLLIHYLRSSRCLLILDNVETILECNGVTQYYPGYEGYGELFSVIGETNHSSCLILTSREKLADIAPLEGMDLMVRSLRLSGSNEAALALLEEKGLLGSQSQKRLLCECYSDNPLLLKTVATLIQDLFDGEIGIFLQHAVLLVSGVRRLIEQQFVRLSPLEESVMYWLAIHRKWTTINELEEDIVPSVLRSQLLEALEKLWGRSLIENQSGSYIQQPIIADYVTEHLIEKICEEIITEKFNLLTSYALFRPVTRQFIEPIVSRLYTTFKSSKHIESKLIQIQAKFQAEPLTSSRYGIKNLMIMLKHVKNI
jgi:hypothetical protein